MPDPTTSPKPPPEGVRTREGLSCPGPRCHAVLKPGQTTCSGRCRVALWRRARADRDREVRALLGAALKLLDNERPMMRTPRDGQYLD
jgi:hypothetical protein